MKKIIAKLALLCVAVAAVMSAVTAYLDHFFTGTFVREKPFWILNQYDRSYDFAVLGSSRAENVIDIETIGRITGKRGINLGVQGTGHAGLYLILNKFLKNNNRVNLLMIQVDAYSLDSRHSYINPFQVHAYLPYITDDNVKETIRANSPSSKFFLWKNLPFSRYVDYNTVYFSYLLNHVLGNAKHRYDATCGSELIEKGGRFKFDKTKIKRLNRELNSNDILYLGKIIELANSMGIKVVLFTAPQYHEYLQFINTRTDALSFFQRTAKQYSIDYVNFESDPLSEDKAVFFDSSHLNARGSRMFSARLAEVVGAALK